MDTDWLIVIVAAALGGAIVWAVATRRYRLQLAALRQQLDKAERAREYSAHQAAQTRKDIDKLRREISKIRRPVPVALAPCKKSGVDVEAASEAGPAPAAPGIPPHGFADTMPM
jgi:septal ring factor EnvC (AmiA/AmiB activator)